MRAKSDLLLYAYLSWNLLIMLDTEKRAPSPNHRIPGMPNLPGMYTACAIGVLAEMLEYMMLIDTSTGSK